MGYKRPFHDEESFQAGFKHPRQEGHTAQQSPILGFLPNNDGPVLSSDEDQNSARKSRDENVAKETASEDLHRVSSELELNASGSSSSFFWVNSDAFNEYAMSDAAVHLSFFPHIFELDHQVTELVQTHDIYSFRLNHPPRKLVPIGPDHQADVPEWASKRFSESSASLDQSNPHMVPADSSGSQVMDDDENEARLVGTCVVPMPEIESSVSGCCADGRRRINCLDRGSVRCVRQHVMEVREELREDLGEKMFEELGFYDMGEEVASQWREDEQHTFRDVVLRNAALQSKNIWDRLSATFPSRTKKELVSYYFNVFMLQKRAEQNRFDPLNIDSDNDEWRMSELVMTDEEDKTTGESLNKKPPHCQENSEEEPLKGIVNDSGTGT